MKYEITADDQEHFQISCADDLKNIIGLRMAPEALEYELSTGNWLVLAFAVWDSRDRPAIEVACQVAAALKNIRVAVRPFEMADEFSTWAPEVAGHEIAVSISESENESNTQVAVTSAEGDHPMWLVFRDGKISNSFIGARTIDEVSSFLEKAVLSDMS